MSIWSMFRWIGVCGAILGGLGFILGVLRTRRSGIRVPMQRAFLAMGSGSLFVAAYLVLPSDALFQQLVVMCVACTLMLTSAYWLKLAVDAAESSGTQK